MLSLHRIFNSIWLIEHDYALNYLPLVSSYIKGEHQYPVQNNEHLVSAENGVLLYNTHGQQFFVKENTRYNKPEDAPQDSIAIIDIVGAITKHDQFCGPAGMQTKANLLTRCYENPKIKNIVIRQETGGGEGYAMRLFNETVEKRNKAVIGFVDDYSCSAGMGNLANCDMIVANSSQARVGSIGSYMTILDFREKFKKEGIELIDVYASASKDKNIEFKEALEGNIKPLRKMVDKFNEAFISQIETARGAKLKEGRDEWGTGKTYFADEALKIGLIDAIDSFDNIHNYFL